MKHIPYCDKIYPLFTAQLFKSERQNILKRGAKKWRKKSEPNTVSPNFAAEVKKRLVLSGKTFFTDETFEIKRVSPDQKIVASLVDKLNKNMVSLLHLYDVVRDLIYETSLLAIK